MSTFKKTYLRKESSTLATADSTSLSLSLKCRFIKGRMPGMPVYTEVSPTEDIKAKHQQQNSTCFLEAGYFTVESHWNVKSQVFCLPAMALLMVNILMCYYWSERAGVAIQAWWGRWELVGDSNKEQEMIPGSQLCGRAVSLRGKWESQWGLGGSCSPRPSLQWSCGLPSSCSPRRAAFSDLLEPLRNSWEPPAPQHHWESWTCEILCTWVEKWLEVTGPQVWKVLLLMVDSSCHHPPGIDWISKWTSAQPLTTKRKETLS